LIRQFISQEEFEPRIKEMKQRLKEIEEEKKKETALESTPPELSSDIQ
jgi:hypothetical protein